jgi:hypothetical protein
MKLLPVIAGLALAAPGAALADGPSLTVRDVPLHVARALAAAAAPRFNMVGLHWRGAGSVSFRVRTADGRWRAWRRSDDDGRVEHGATTDQGTASPNGQAAVRVATVVAASAFVLHTAREAIYLSPGHGLK